MTETTRPTPEERRDAALRIEAFQAVREGWLHEDRVDEYVTEMRKTAWGQGMALSFALQDLRDELLRPVRWLYGRLTR